MNRRQTGIAAALTLIVTVSTLFAKDTEWPLTINTPEGKVSVYQPQPDAFKYDMLDARAAVAFTASGATQPQFGAVWLSTHIQVDRESRTYTAHELKVTQARFPGATPQQISAITGAIERAAKGAIISGSLDRLAASLELAEQEQASARDLNTDPPKFVFSDVPSLLVMIDGEPQLRPTSVEAVQRVINTPVALLYSTRTKKYYLTDGSHWVSSPDVKGPYAPDGNPPQEIISSAPPDTSSSRSDAAKAHPRVVVSMEPTELIVTEGKPNFTPVTGTNLLYVKNTDRTVIMDINSQDYFILAAGRWYRSGSLSGGWVYVHSDSLPADFSKIPSKSDLGDVRTFVAGTTESRDAVLDASIPQTSAVNRTDSSLTVFYDGEPKFEPIKGTEMLYAANTEYSVLLIKGRYYCCHQAVWYDAPGPKGPWMICTNVPDEVYSQPPSSPTYNTKYVYVYDATPSVVYVGYLPGYTGCYVYGPTIVYGTGWHYPPWYGAYYYPRPVTYGFGVHYNPWSGWGFTFGWSAGYVSYGVHFHSHYRPPYYRPPYYGGGWYGPGGYRPPPPGYRPGYRPPPPRPTPYASGGRTPANSNIYGRSGNRSRNTNINTLPANQRPKATRGGTNNVYVDRDGNVFRRDNSGQWQQRQGNTWTKPTTPTARPATPEARPGTKPAQPEGRPATPQTRQAQPQARPSPPATQPRLDRDANSRQRGAQRQQDYRQKSGGAAPSRAGGKRR